MVPDVALPESHDKFAFLVRHTVRTSRRDQSERAGYPSHDHPSYECTTVYISLRVENEHGHVESTVLGPFSRGIFTLVHFLMDIETCFWNGPKPEWRGLDVGCMAHERKAALCPWMCRIGDRL